MTEKYLKIRILSSRYRPNNAAVKISIEASYFAATEAKEASFWRPKIAWLNVNKTKIRPTASCNVKYLISDTFILCLEYSYINGGDGNLNSQTFTLQSLFDFKHAKFFRLAPKSRGRASRQ